jgi:hypothetical protein
MIETKRTIQTPDISTVLSLLEEVYLELSARYGWKPVNCFYYSSKFNVCYGAPIPLGNKDVWGREGLFEELNKKLLERKYKPLTWDEFKKILREIRNPGIVDVIEFSSRYTRQIEPHSIMFHKPVFITLT